MSAVALKMGETKDGSRNENEIDKPKITGSADMTRRMVCGGLAGMIAKTVTNPLERIKMLSQTGEHGLKGRETNILSMYRGILKNEGIMGLWAGNGVNLLRIFPAKATVFATNDFFKSTLCRLTGTASATGTISFFAGGLAGMTATALTYPLDFARGRIQGKLAAVAPSSSAQDINGRRVAKDYNGIVRTLVLTVKDEGVLAMYKGIQPTILGAMPYEGIKFGTVGVLEQIFPARSDQPPSYYAIRKMFMGGMGGVMAGLITYPNDTIRRLLQLQGSRGTTVHYKGYWDCAIKVYKAEGIRRFYLGLTINLIRMAPNAAVQFGSYEILKRWTYAIL